MRNRLNVDDFHPIVALDYYHPSFPHGTLLTSRTSYGKVKKTLEFEGSADFVISLCFNIFLKKTYLNIFLKKAYLNIFLKKAYLNIFLMNANLLSIHRFISKKGPLDL